MATPQWVSESWLHHKWVSVFHSWVSVFHSWVSVIHSWATRRELDNNPILPLVDNEKQF